MKGQVKVENEDFTKMLKDADYQKVSELEKTFKFKKNIPKEPRFGNCSIIQDPRTNQLVVVKERRANDKKEAARLILEARKLKSQKHPNLLNMMDYSVTKHSELCSSFFIIKYFYEYPKSDLDRESKNRNVNNQDFTHNELTHILYQQIHANHYLESQGTHHGDIRPINIAYDKNNFTSKLINDNEFEPNSRVTKDRQRNRLQDGYPIYQSPEMFKNLMKKNLNFQVDNSKEDVYATGLSLLEVANGRSVQNIYDKKKGEVDQVALESHLQEFRNKHGNQNTLLCTTLESMMAPNEADRPNFSDIKANIPDYEGIKPFLAEDSMIQNNRNVPNLYNQNTKPQTKVHSTPDSFPMYTNDSTHNTIRTEPTEYKETTYDTIDFPNQKKKTIVNSNAEYLPQIENNQFQKQTPQTTYQHVQEVHTNPTPFYQNTNVYNVNSQPENYVIKHEYRRGVEVSEPVVIRENRPSYLPYQNDHVVRQSNPIQYNEVKTNYVAPQYNEVRTNYVAPQYNEVRTSYVAPQYNEVRTNYVAPQTEVIRTSYVHQDEYVYQQNQPARVQYSPSQEHVGELKLVKTYEDSKFAR
jgi:hypothetical protein